MEASAPDAAPDAAVTADGSPVAVYLAAPPGDTAVVLAAVAPPPARVLELGAGVGRETRPLIACGYEVTAVDDSPVMLQHVTGARTVEADLHTLALGERFDVVLAGSHFVDDADPARRTALLATCARHVEPDGVVLVERYDPDWTRRPASYAGTAGPVRITFEVLDDSDGVVSARLEYVLLGRRWEQRFAFVRVTEESLAEEAEQHGLAVVGVHGEDDTWLALRPTGRPR